MARIQDIIGQQGASSGALSATASGAAIGFNNSVTGALVFTGANNLFYFSTITDDKGNLYNIIDSIGSGQTWVVSFNLSYITNSPATLTANFASGVQFPQIMYEENSGILGLGGHTISVQSSPGTGTDLITSGSISTSLPNTIIYGADFNVSAYSNVFAGTNYTSGIHDISITAWGAISEFETLTSPGSVATTFTSSSGDVTTFFTTAVALPTQFLSSADSPSRTESLRLELADP